MMPDGMMEVKKVKYEDGCCAPSEDPHYPYGTTLVIKDEMIADLGVESLVVDDTVRINALAVVISKSEYKDETTQESTSDKRIEVQLTDIGMNRDQNQDRAEQLYGG